MEDLTLAYEIWEDAGASVTNRYLSKIYFARQGDQSGGRLSGSKPRGLWFILHAHHNHPL